MKFSTAGSMGDSVYSTLFMKELTEATGEQLEHINIQYGKPGAYSQPHVYGNQQLTKGAAEFLAPLFEAQGWKTTISNAVPNGYIDLDGFRKLRLNFGSNDIRLWVYNLVNNFLPMNLQRPIIKATPNEAFKGRIILARTSRYNNYYLNLKALEPLKDRIVMIGLEEEHKSFSKEFFPVELYKVKNALDAAQVIAGADWMISNQCGLYSIAEMMKTPRVLLTAEFFVIKHPQTKQDLLVPGPCNVIAQGGKCAMAGTTAKLEAIVKKLNL